MRADAVEAPFSSEEEASLIYSAEGRVKATLQMMRCQNIQLIWHLNQWKNYRANLEPKPEKDVAQLLSPGMTKGDFEVENLKSVARYYAQFPHGRTPQFDEFREATKSYFSLLLHLGAFASTEHLYNARAYFKDFSNLVMYSGEPEIDRDTFGSLLLDSVHKFIEERRVNAMEVGIFLSSPPKPKAAKPAEKEPPLAIQRDEIRRRAVSLMRGYQRKYDCTTSLALKVVQNALWKQFEHVGLKSGINNFKFLFYSSRFRGSPPADEDELKRAGLDT